MTCCGPIHQNGPWDQIPSIFQGKQNQKFIFFMFEKYCFFLFGERMEMGLYFVVISILVVLQPCNDKVCVDLSENRGALIMGGRYLLVRRWVMLIK